MLRLFKSMVNNLAVNKSRILLVDDHRILLEGTASLLSGLEDYEVAAMASSGKKPWHS